MKELNCDVLVVGAGAAGLCAAIAAARKDLKVILIEKNSEIGYKIKGEQIKKDAPILNTIFGDKPPIHAYYKDMNSSRIYSPSTKKHINIKNPTPNVAIEYRAFIIEIFKQLSKTSCEVHVDTELVDVIKEGERVIGATCKQGSEELQINAKFIIAADGNHSVISKKLGLFQQKEVYHALKVNCENIKVPDPDRIELYLLLDPPGALWMFPRGPTSGELGLTVWTHDLPKDFDIMKMWNIVSKEHPLVKEILKDAKTFYLSRDYLNFGGPVKNIFGNGVTFVGDSGGHVGGIGAAGIISCMTTGHDIGDFVAESLKLEDSVTEGMIKEFERKYKKTPMAKFLKGEKGYGKSFRTILFETFGTAEKIDENWARLEDMVGTSGF